MKRTALILLAFAALALAYHHASAFVGEPTRFDLCGLECDG